MTNMLSPYIVFNGQTREALEFYASVFGGTPRFNTFGDFGGAPEGFPADAVMHGQLDTDAGWSIMAADSTKPGDEVVRGGMNLAISGDEVDTIRGYFERLAEGGTVNMPFEKQMWGDLYGDVTDKYGINWGFNATDPEGAAASNG